MQSGRRGETPIRNLGGGVLARTKERSSYTAERPSEDLPQASKHGDIRKKGRAESVIVAKRGQKTRERTSRDKPRRQYAPSQAQATLAIMGASGGVSFGVCRPQQLHYCISLSFACYFSDGPGRNNNMFRSSLVLSEYTLQAVHYTTLLLRPSAIRV